MATVGLGPTSAAPGPHLGAQILSLKVWQELGVGSHSVPAFFLVQTAERKLGFVAPVRDSA